MCLNCGCGQLDTRHKATDLIRADVRKAAEGQGTSMEATLGNLERSLREMRSGSGSGLQGGATTATTTGATSR